MMDRRNFIARLLVAILALLGIEWKVAEEKVTVLERWDHVGDGVYKSSWSVIEDDGKECYIVDYVNAFCQPRGGHGVLTGISA